ncbi:hypothetical protein JXB27_04260 [Candidatus Woesearchaeota archaeon]|nr:hypothetical protein [Candidatus Woesearchaeota archaeon]
MRNKDYQTLVELVRQKDAEKTRKDDSFRFQGVSFPLPGVQNDSFDYTFAVNPGRTFGTKIKSLEEHANQNVVDRLSYPDEFVMDIDSILEVRLNKNKFSKDNFLLVAKNGADMDTVDDKYLQALESCAEFASKHDCILTLNRYKGGVASQKKFHVQVFDKDGTFLDGLRSDNFGNVHYSYKHPTERVASWFGHAYKIGDYFSSNKEKGKANLVMLMKDKLKNAYDVQKKVDARIPLVISKDAVLLVPNKKEVAISSSPVFNLRSGAVEATGKYIPLPFAVYNNPQVKTNPNFILDEVSHFMFDYYDLFNHTSDARSSLVTDKIKLNPGY